MEIGEAGTAREAIWCSEAVLASPTCTGTRVYDPILEAIAQNRRLALDDLEGWNRSIPRINMLSDGSSHTRIRLACTGSSTQLIKYAIFLWTSHRHDGKPWQLNNYRMDLIVHSGYVTQTCPPEQGRSQWHDRQQVLD